MNKKGLAQIPLMIGLLVMAVAVPVATKLVQESQDTRNRAASVITTTPPPSGCTEGYVRCFNNVQQGCQNGSWVFQINCPNGCSGNYCKVVSTSTPRPSTSTPKPPTSTPKPCINATCASDCSRSPGYTGTCVNNVCKCTLKPTSTPPTCLNISDQFCTTGSCSSSGATAGSGTCLSGQTCCKPGYVWDTPTPTRYLSPTPKQPTSTPNPCSVTSNKPLNCTCSYSSQCASGYCSGVCLTNLTTCNQVFETRRCENSAEYTCTNDVWVKTKTCTGPCVNNACPKPTATPRSCQGTAGSGVCRSNGCLSGETDGGQGNCSAPGIRCCAPKSPTPISCKYGKCESGDEGMTKCVNNAQYFCDGDCYVWVKNCPNGCSGNFCKTTPTSTPTKKPPTNTPTPTGPLKCYCQGNCGDSDNCNWQSAAGGGYIRYCPGYCSGVPTPRQPTNTPTPTLQCNNNTLGKCGAAGGCKLGEKCKTYDNGLSYVCRIDDDCKQLPTLIPTSTPTSVPGVCSRYPMPNGCNCSNGSGCSSGYCSEAGKCENPPSPSNKCPGAEACPNPNNKNLLQNCTPPDSDGTPKDTLCNEVGMIRPCGGKNYCCPSTGGAWTTDMSKCPTTCTQCVGKPEAKSKGDADCSGVTNLNDFSIWRDEFITGALGVTAKNSWRADFDCNGKVSLNDFSIWRDNFIKSL